jgi:spectinomycin phosphotransferase
MRTRPDDIADGELIAHVSRLWNLNLIGAEYAPVGGGSHHWRAHDSAGWRYWLNVDDLDRKQYLATSRSGAFEALRAALVTAAALGDAGLEFVVAPLPTRAGERLTHFGAHYAVAVNPLLDASAYAFDQVLPPDIREALLSVLARLHAETPRVCEVAPPWQPEIALRADLEDALDHHATRWTGGPLSESARALIAANDRMLRVALAHFDVLVQAVTAATAAGDLVVTHGEPHPGNLLNASGELYLVDWDTVALAPRERDLWLVRGFAGEANPSALDLYRLRWKLLDLASYTAVLRAPHIDTADARHALRAIEITLSELASPAETG